MEETIDAKLNCYCILWKWFLIVWIYTCRKDERCVELSQNSLHSGSFSLRIHIKIMSLQHVYKTEIEHMSKAGLK